jgi:hypothetical protein
MAIIAKEGRSFEPCPQGSQQAVCVDVIDRGELETPWGIKHKVDIVWQSAELMETAKPFLVTKRYTLSLHEKSALRHDLQGWRGREFTDAELAGFDLESVLGVNCILTVIHKKGSKGGTFANVNSIAPLMKGQTKLKPIEYVRFIDRAPEPSDADNDMAPLDDSDIPF